MRNAGLHILGWPALAVLLIALPHGLSFSQQEILVFLTINVLLVTSYRLLTLTGEWSLGHVVIMGVGAYVAAVLGSDPEGLRLGFGLPMWIWLPAAGIAAAGIGVAFGPAAVRVRGLYLAFVTLGLVFGS